MPRLTRVYGMEDLNPKACYYVDQDEWGYSADAPLATTGAAPCLNVIVHCQNKGCLAHVWNTSTNQTELYNKACRTVLTMLSQLKVVEGIEIWLGAGHVFSLGSRWIVSGAVGVDFPEYLERSLHSRNYRSITFLDDRTAGPNTDWDPGNIAYAPQTGNIYLLQHKDWSNENSIAVHTGVRAKLRGKCG